MDKIKNFFHKNKTEEFPRLEKLRDLLQIYHQQNDLSVDLKDFQPNRLVAYGKQLLGDEIFWKEQEGNIKMYLLEDHRRVSSEDFRKMLEESYENTLIEDYGLGEWIEDSLEDKVVK